MKILDSITRPRTKLTARVVSIALVTAVFIGGAMWLVAPSLPGSLRSEQTVDALALKWFAQMQTGQIDRAQLTPDYNDRLTNDAVREMSQYLKEHDYGVPPKRAEVIQTRSSSDQTLYVVKLVFPRGDAASLLFGFNTQGKITGISLLSMAGD